MYNLYLSDDNKKNFSYRDCTNEFCQFTIGNEVNSSYELKFENNMIKGLRLNKMGIMKSWIISTKLNNFRVEKCLSYDSNLKKEICNFNIFTLYEKENENFM